eukprot:3859438-Amphidinium_carterae.1
MCIRDRSCHGWLDRLELQSHQQSMHQLNISWLLAKSSSSHCCGFSSRASLYGSQNSMTSLVFSMWIIRGLPPPCCVCRDVLPQSYKVDS